MTDLVSGRVMVIIIEEILGKKNDTVDIRDSANRMKRQGFEN